MPHPFFVFTRKEFRYLIVIFLLGIIFGTTVYNLYISRKIDSLILKNNELTSQVKQQKEEINQLEDNLKQYSGRFVQNIKVNINSNLNEHRQQAVTNRIIELLQDIPGKRIRDIDPEIINDIIDHRLLQIENNTYQLKLNYLVLGEKLTLYVTVKLKE